MPDGSCSGTGQVPIAGSEDADRHGRPTGVCPVCLGRFRLAGGVVPNHSPSPAGRR